MSKPKRHALNPEPADFSIALGVDFSATVKRRLPPSHPAYALIGRVAAEWAQLEHTLDTIIWELAGLDPLTGSCITVRIGCRLKCQAILALAKKHGTPAGLIEETNKILNRAQKKFEKRNQYVHDA